MPPPQALRTSVSTNKESKERREKGREDRRRIPGLAVCMLPPWNGIGSVRIVRLPERRNRRSSVQRVGHQRGGIQAPVDAVITGNIAGLIERGVRQHFLIEDRLEVHRVHVDQRLDTVYQ